MHAVISRSMMNICTQQQRFSVQVRTEQIPLTFELLLALLLRKELIFEIGERNSYRNPCMLNINQSEVPRR